MSSDNDGHDPRDESGEPTAGGVGADGGEGAVDGGDRDGSLDPLEALQRDRDRLQDQLQRAMADLQNIRKRHGKEMDEARRRAKGDLAHELLPVLDNFRFALEAHEQQEDGVEQEQSRAMIEGLRMVRTLLEGTLERHGLAEIPALGGPFDPNVHEAVGVDPTAAADPGHVTQVVQPGYRFGERVLRPTKVLVSGDGARRADDTEQE